MVADDEAPFPEPFGTLYVRPPGAPCPDCDCCTLRLCQLAASKDGPCSHHSDDPQAVSGCPCTVSAERRARVRDDTYIAEHGNDVLDTGHLRDPKGDEAAHG